MFTGSGTSGTSAAIASFEAAAGGGDNGTIAGEQPGGFRHATWDQIALNGSDPGSTTIDSGHVIVPARSRLQPWGLDLGPEIAVSGDGFQSVSSAQFTPFSPANVWGPFNTDTAEFDVAAPAAQGSTPTPAQTRGLGFVLLDAERIPARSSTSTGRSSLATVPAPRARPSFGGVLFPDPVVTRVVVTFGCVDLHVGRQHGHERGAELGRRRRHPPVRARAGSAAR